jgi:hypothetical protein
MQRAVTPVKPERASKVMMRVPTRLNFGKGSAGRREVDKRTRSIHRGSGHGALELRTG